MSNIVAGKKSRKKQSRFEKLWARVARLKDQNEKFSKELDSLVKRMDAEIKPREVELAQIQIPLLQKLLTLGQRKSMTNWERETLDEWIRELVEITHMYGLVQPELLDDIARYDAFRMGITLEDDSLPPHQQFVEMMQKADEEHEEEIKRQQEQFEQNAQETKEAMIKDAQQQVERELDSILGPEPDLPEKQKATGDLWPDELETEQTRRVNLYREKREKLKAQKMAGKLAEIDDLMESGLFDDDDDDDEFDFDDFDFSAFEEAIGADDGNPQNRGDAAAPSTALSNETFQKLFRATAGKLHPDREPDEDRRKEKQKLMANLLKARKKGDVMTVLEMYETHVGQHEGFSKSDQKALLNSLENMVEDLEDEKEEIIFQSPSHGAAYHLFYDRSKSKVNKAFTERLAEIKHQERIVLSQTKEIRSLKTLKPQLEERYQMMTLSEPSFEDFMQFVDDNTPF